MVSGRVSHLGAEQSTHIQWCHQDVGHGVHVHKRVDNCVYTSLALEIYMSIEIAKSVYVRKLHAGGGTCPSHHHRITQCPIAGDANAQINSAWLSFRG